MADDLRRALDGAIEGNKEAQEWLLANEGSLTEGYVEVLASEAEPEGRRQLAGVALRRVASGADAGLRMEVLPRLLTFVEAHLAAPQLPQAERKPVLAACDAAAALLFRSPAELVDRIVFGAAQHDTEASHRLLYSLATVHKRLPRDSPIAAALYQRVVFPFLENTDLAAAAAAGQLEAVARRLSIVRHAVTARFCVADREAFSRAVCRFAFWGGAPQPPPPEAGPQHLTREAQIPLAVRLSLQARSALFGNVSIVTDLFRLLPLCTDHLAAPGTLLLGEALLTFYAARCQDGTYCGVAFSADEPYERGQGQLDEVDTYYTFASDLTALQSVLDAVWQHCTWTRPVCFEGRSGAGASPETQPNLHLAAGYLTRSAGLLLQLMCLRDCEAEELETLDLALLPDPPPSLLCCIIWHFAQFLEDGGLFPGAPEVVAGTVHEALRTAKNATDISSALVLLQKLVEGSQLPASAAPLEGVMQLFTFRAGDAAFNPAALRLGPAESGEVRGRACLLLASLAQQLPPQQHAHLIHLQCAQLADETAVPTLRRAAAMGLGHAVAEMCKGGQEAEAAVRHHLQLGEVRACLPAFLSAFRDDPSLLFDSFAGLLQVLPSAAITGESLQQLLLTLLDVLKRNTANAHLCNRVVHNLVCQGIIEEHDGASGELCQPIIDFALYLMHEILGSTSAQLQPLHTRMFDLGSALVRQSCRCCSVAEGLLGWLSRQEVSGKLTVRAAARAVALAASACARQKGPLGEGLCGVLHGFYEKALGEEHDCLTLGAVAASCVSSCAHLPPDAAFARLAAHCAKMAVHFERTTNDWTWPPHLCLVWCALLGRSAAGAGCTPALAQQMLGLLGGGEDQMHFFAAWLSVDSLFERRARPVSTLAAQLLLAALPGEMLAEPVQLLPIGMFTKRKRPPKPELRIPLRQALLLAQVREVTAVPGAEYATFLKNELMADIPVSDTAAVQDRAMQLLGSLDQASQDQLNRLLHEASPNQRIEPKP